MAEITIWGSELSPFTLKLWALLDCARLPYRSLPAAGRSAENIKLALRLAREKRARSVVRHGGISALDEYPSVPFLIEATGRIQYDSSALALWLDQHPERRSPAFHPDAPAARFVAQLIDESFDEFGLYLVHHKRWVESAATNDAGTRLAGEFRRVIPFGLRQRFASHFARRQVRRLPYLFSVAPDDFSAGVDPELTPPAHGDFPETHGLLDGAWREHIDAIEHILEQQPFLLGRRFTIADASVYGEFGMNLKDPTTAKAMREIAPHSFAWLERIRAREHLDASGEIELSPRLEPLLRAITRYFVPLMQQNAAAHRDAVARGERRFNEAAFDRGEALYDGRLAGRPFRSVVKSFQVPVWRALCVSWQALSPDDQRALCRLAGDDLRGLDEDMPTL